MQHLTEFQLSVLSECVEKGSGGISLPMGSGKTLIGLALALKQREMTENPSPVLVVSSKSLLQSWVSEYNKFFGDLNYKLTVLHGVDINDYNITADAPDLIFCTIDTISKWYRHYRIEDVFTFETQQPTYRDLYAIVKNFHRPTKPFIKNATGIGSEIFFSTEFPVLIVDEIQGYTNITSARCKGLAAICAKHRWGLSGTIFNEPKPERILGYYLIINHPEFPRTLPEATEFIKTRQFKGTAETTVSRVQNGLFTEKPKYNQQIITHKMTPGEMQMYRATKDIFSELQQKIDRNRTDIDIVRKFSSYKLALIVYLRQAILNPLIPITAALIDCCDLENKNDLAEIMKREFHKRGLHNYMNNMGSVESSRTKEALKLINKHDKEQIILFSSFRSYINFLRAVLVEKGTTATRQVFTLDSQMSPTRRETTINEFRETTNGILLLTYDIGAEGLNLQTCHNVVLLDFWWNDGKTQQAIARVYRFGQTAKVVNIYLCTSNTGIENIVFRKQQDKLRILKQLETGPTGEDERVTKITTNDIIDFLQESDNSNEQLLEGISNMKIK